MMQSNIIDKRIDTQSAIVIDKLCVHYQDHQALQNISGSFNSASMTAIIGPNGGGKSTFLKAILQLVPIHSGKIQFHNLTSQDIAYVPQLSEIDRGFPLIVEEAVAFGFCQQFGFFKSIKLAAQNEIDHVLKEVGLYGVKHKTLDTLSGGQFQRVLFARLSLQRSKFIILDEPFAAVDSHTVDELMNMIVKWHAMGKSIIMVSHDLDLVTRYFSQTVLIAGQCVDWGKTSDVMNDDNINISRQLLRHSGNHSFVSSADFQSLTTKC